MIALRSNFRGIDNVIGELSKGLSDHVFAQAAEAEARLHLNRMREHELDAPGPRPPARNPFTDRVRRVTGQLADTAFIRAENNGLRQVIVFPAAHAKHHDQTFSPHQPRNIYQDSLHRRWAEIQANMRRNIDRLVSGI